MYGHHNGKDGGSRTPSQRFGISDVPVTPRPYLRMSATLEQFLLTWTILRPVISLNLSQTESSQERRSRWRDSNPRSERPKRPAIPDFATPRYFTYYCQGSVSSSEELFDTTNDSISIFYLREDNVLVVLKRLFKIVYQLSRAILTFHLSITELIRPRN